jgi:hypothetical protein
MLAIAEPAAGVVGIGRGLFHHRVDADHLPGNQILPNAKVLERALSLRTPESFCGHPHLTQAFRFGAKRCHNHLPGSRATCEEPESLIPDLGEQYNIDLFCKLNSRPDCLESAI